MAKPAGNALRVELRPFESALGAANGDVTNTGGYLANRAEVYARHAVPGSSPANAWADPAGAERWYGFSLLVPVGQTFATDTTWMTLAQWKGRDGPGPPIALELKRDHLRLGGTRGNAGAFQSDGDLGVVVPGTWTRIVVGMRISPNPAMGWVEMWRDGRQLVSRTPVATMDRLTDGVTPDPIYLKQGIYRSTAWRTTQVLWFGPTRIGTNRGAVG